MSATLANANTLSSGLVLLQALHGDLTLVVNPVLETVSVVVVALPDAVAVLHLHAVAVAVAVTTLLAKTNAVTETMNVVTVVATTALAAPMTGQSPSHIFGALHTDNPNKIVTAK